MPYSKAVILVLGYKNDTAGTLLPVARQRCDRARQLYQNHTLPIMCTGGYGERFNATPEPHAEHLKRYITACGVPAKAFEPHVLSQNTYEDGKLTQDVLRDDPEREILLVTSDFHMQRAFLWMKHFMPETKVSCHPAETLVADEELTTLRAHEVRAINHFYQDFPNAPSVESFPDWYLN